MKRNYWPLFFIGIFTFAFCMIVWTISSTIKVPVHEDKSFLSSYHDVDRDYNKIVSSNKDFEKKYDFKLVINKKEFGLDYMDMFLAQRAIEQKSSHKNIFRASDNKIKVVVIDRATGKLVEDLGINLMITVPTNDSHTVELSSKDFILSSENYSSSFVLPYKGNWNITGQFKAGKNTGYVFIKSNAI